MEPTREHSIEIPKGRKTNALPPIIVKFQETNGKQWTSLLSPSEKRVWNHSVPDYRDWDPEKKSALINFEGRNSDLEIIMKAFLRVRNTKSLTFQLPSGAYYDQPKNSDFIRILTKEIDRVTKSDIPFGLNYERRKYWQFAIPNETFDDDIILRYEDSLHTWLDYLLDDMEGRSAALLRGERIENWCNEYDRLLSIRGSEQTFGGSMFMGRREWEMAEAFVDRYGAAQVIGLGAYDPDGVVRKSENELWPKRLSSALYDADLVGEQPFEISHRLTLTTDHRPTLCEVFGDPGFMKPCKICDQDELSRELRKLYPGMEEKLDRFLCEKYIPGWIYRFESIEVFCAKVMKASALPFPEEDYE